MPVTRALFGVMLVLSPMRSSFGQEGDAANLLLRMSNALATLNYQGSFVYEHNGQLDALRLFHAGGSAEHERLVSMSGPRSELVRDGYSITCLQADTTSMVFPNRPGARLLPLVPDTRGASFQKLYSLSVGGPDRVAGYNARTIDISPRDGWRYGYRLWLDQDNFMLLRSAVVDSAERVLEQFMFVALDVGAKPKESDLAAGSGFNAVLPANEIALAGPRWRVADPPPGFHLVRTLQPAQGPTQAEHHSYSDGVATVSVYIEPLDPKLSAAQDSASTRGVLSIYAHVAGNWKFTALGDVPRATVQRMARSIQPLNSGAPQPAP
jgi:sigma-E factor negative regulatory protein RseB